MMAAASPLRRLWILSPNMFTFVMLVLLSMLAVTPAHAASAVNISTPTLGTRWSRVRRALLA